MREQIRLPLLSRVPTWAWVMIDAGIALVFAASFIGLAASRSLSGSDVLDYGAALATSLPVAVRRLWPRSVFVIVLLGGLGMREFLIPHADLLCLPLALYTLATRSRAVLSLLVAGVVAMQGVVELPLSAVVRDRLGLVLAILAASWAAGTAVRQRRLYTEQLAAQAEERARAEAMAERLRIARELHDLIGHSLSTIAVQAGVAGHVGGAEEMGHTLASIEETSRSALRETRQLLGVLRKDGESGSRAELAPAPGLADLDALVTRTRAANLEVKLQINGDVGGEMGPTVYRIVQEALTNVLKHAGAHHVLVRIERQEDGLTVEVTDDGTQGRTQPYGHGLTGLCERVQLYGGEFEAGARPVRGFRVMARLPL